MQQAYVEYKVESDRFYLCYYMYLLLRLQLTAKYV